jgi:hypothetical protein
MAQACPDTVRAPGWAQVADDECGRIVSDQAGFIVAPENSACLTLAAGNGDASLLTWNDVCRCQCEYVASLMTTGIHQQRGQDERQVT